MSKEGKFINLEYYLSFSNKKFYYVDDLRFTLKQLRLNSSGKKRELAERLDVFYKSLRRYQSNINIIIGIQRRYKQKLENKNLLLKGPGFKNKETCVNDEDFLTFESKYELDSDYFFSYKDNSSVIFFFDIRSLAKLLELNKNNPYTTEPFPQYVKDKVERIINDLKKRGVYEEHEEFELSADQIYKARVISLFQTIDELDIVAGGADPNWFLDLDFKKMKDFFRTLEDIWNYRAELTNQRKTELVPKRKILYLNPKIIYILKENSSKFKKLKDYLLSEMEEMVTSSSNIENRKTCALFILTAFTEINPRAAEALPWLVQH